MTTAAKQESACIGVLLAEDHPVSRSGLSALLSSVHGYRVVGEASNGEQAVELARELRPEVVIMDLEMPVMNGFEAIERIVNERPEMGILVLSYSDEDASVFEAMRAGARGYVCKDADPDDILLAIQAVARGETIFGGQTLAENARSWFAVGLSKASRPFPHLTERELEVLDLMARPSNDKEIARELGLSQKTVRNYASTIYNKLGLTGRSEAIIAARETGLGRRRNVSR